MSSQKVWRSSWDFIFRFSSFFYYHLLIINHCMLQHDDNRYYEYIQHDNILTYTHVYIHILHTFLVKSGTHALLDATIRGVFGVEPRYINTYWCVYKYTHVNVFTCMWMYIHVYKWIYTRIHMDIHVHTSKIHVCKCM